MAVSSAAQGFLAEGKQRGLTDAAGDHDQVLGCPWREAVSERTPDIEFLTGLARRESARHLAECEVDDVDRGRLPVFIEDRVVQREWPAQERIVHIGQPKHHE